MGSLECLTVFTVPTTLTTSKNSGESESLSLSSCVTLILCRWVYISDRKTHSLITPPYHLTSLVNQEEVELKFTAPSKEGIYNFTVCVRSDSYLGVDLLEDIKLDVQKAWEAPKEHKQWDFSVTFNKEKNVFELPPIYQDEDEDDENKKDESEESEYAEDSDFEDDSD